MVDWRRLTMPIQLTNTARRKAMSTLLGLAACGAAPAILARAPRKVGFLSVAEPSQTARSGDAMLRAALARRGLVDGREIVLKAGYAAGSSVRLKELAGELTS